jgi:hypothetical protein
MAASSDQSPYAAAKAAMDSLASNYAYEVARFGSDNHDYPLSTAHRVNRAQNPADHSCGPFCLFWVQASPMM